MEVAALKTVRPSEDAVSVLRRRVARERVEVTDKTRPLYRELVDAGLMIPLATFAHGRESAFRLTEAAVNFLSTHVPSA